MTGASDRAADAATQQRQRLQRVVVAGHRGDEDLATAHLGDPSAAIRAAALSALGRIGSITVEIIEAAFSDPEPLVRRRAAELSVRVAHTSPETLLSDTDPSVVEISCFAAGEVDWTARDGSPPIAALATIATSHEDALCRESAAAALGAIGDPAGLDAVLHACGDRVTVRRRAVLALAAFDDMRVDAALKTALDDKDWQVRQAAEDLLEVNRTLHGDPDPDAYAG